MLFNSQAFLLFVGALIAGAFIAQRQSARRLVLVLIAASLFFYSYWEPIHLPLLLGSLAFNFVLGPHVYRMQSKGLLAFGVGCNVALLGWFKYANWVSGNLDVLGFWPGNPTSIILPLAISFFTFEQISYLVDCYRRVVKPGNLLEYAFFVSFFPKLIAGPIVRFSEIRDQVDKVGISAASLAMGGTLFFLGLGKKLFIADSAAPYADAVFNAAHDGVAVGTIDAWIGAFAYTFQLYFDFSAYSDMAIGLAMVFGVYLPINFYSPYKATSIIEFWRRWHMTLSRFLRDYLYFPLGGNRKGPIRRYLNLIVVMTIGGLWHGAGSTFVVWGLLHGIYLAGNHLFRAVAARFNRLPKGLAPIAAALSWTLTFVLVVVAWVFFRSDGFSTAVGILTSMSAIGTIPTESVIDEQARAAATILLMLAICLIFPNTNQIIGREAIDPGRTDSSLFPDEARQTLIRWSPNTVWGLAIGSLAAAGILALSDPSPFLYFAF